MEKFLKFLKFLLIEMRLHRIFFIIYIVNVLIISLIINLKLRNFSLTFSTFSKLALSYFSRMLRKLPAMIIIQISKVFCSNISFTYTRNFHNQIKSIENLVLYLMYSGRKPLTRFLHLVCNFDSSAIS